MARTGTRVNADKSGTESVHHSTRLTGTGRGKGVAFVNRLADARPATKEQVERQAEQVSVH